MDRSNVDLLDKSFFVLLRASINTMKTRMEKDVPRPSLTKNDSISEIEEIVLERMPLYEKIADIIIDTDKLSVYEICDKILLELEKRSMV